MSRGTLARSKLQRNLACRRADGALQAKPRPIFTWEHLHAGRNASRAQMFPATWLGDATVSTTRGGTMSVGVFFAGFRHGAFANAARHFLPLRFAREGIEGQLRDRSYEVFSL